MRAYRARQKAKAAAVEAVAPPKLRVIRPFPDDLKPFTVEHFRRWALDLTLDNGEAWVVDPYFEAFLEDYFAGVPECWLIVGEGNAKTTNLGGLGVYILEFRPNPSVPWAASSRDQAEIGYRQAEGFVVRSPRLLSFLKCQEGYRRIKRTDGTGRLQIFAADDGTGDGIIPTDAFLDELHRHKNLKLYRTWSGKLNKRGGQLATISTGGEYGSEFEITRERIRQTTPLVVKESGYTHCRSPRMAFHEYATPEGADVEDMAIAKLANPFSGITVESLAEKFATPTMTLAHWMRFTCNVPTRSDDAAITEAEWWAAATDQEIPEGEPIWLGLDVAWKWDTTAMVPFWMTDNEHRLLGPASVLTPPRDGNSLDPDKVERALWEIHQRNPIHTVVMDMSRAEQLASWIEKHLGSVVIDRQQTNPQAVQDFDDFMEALRNGWLKHAGDAEMAKHALNATAHILPLGDARFDRPSQSRSGPEQERRVIDALTAAAMVNSTATRIEPRRGFQSAWA
jgi:phage terminase large subunit-like protein